MKKNKLLQVCPRLAWHAILGSALFLTGVASSITYAADPVAATAYFTIKSRWSGAYLVDGGNNVQYKTEAPGTDTAYQWSFVGRGLNQYAIQNRKTGDLINIERLQEFAQSDRSCPATGDSCKWIMEKTPDGFYRLRSAWQAGNYLHIQNLRGSVQQGPIYDIWASAQWQIAPAASSQETEDTFFLIKNRWNSNYLVDGGDDLLYGNTDPQKNTAYHWTLVARGDNYSDIRNRKTGELINIEGLKDSVQSDKACPPLVGDSCKWATEKASNGYFRLRSGWQMNNYLHIQDLKGYVQHGRMYPVWESAQWQFVQLQLPQVLSGRNNSSLQNKIAKAEQAAIAKEEAEKANQPPVTLPPAGSENPASGNAPDGSQPAGSLNAQSLGVVGDGRTDNQSSLQSAINNARSQGKVLWLPAGTYNHSGVLVLNGVHLKGSGSGTILHALNPDQSAIELTGNNSAISNLKTTVLAPNRSSMYYPAAILVRNASNASVSYIIAQGASSNGIRLDNATGSQIHNNLVLGTNADGIALMNGSSGNTVRNNVVYQAADDSFSDNSYLGEARQDSNNTFEGNMSLRNAYGRGIVLAGSRNAMVRNNIVVSSLWIGIAADTDHNSSTMESSGHSIINNVFIDNTRGEIVKATGPGMTVSGNQVSNSVPSVPSILGWDPGPLPDRFSFNSIYKPGTGPGANNTGGNRS